MVEQEKEKVIFDPSEWTAEADEDLFLSGALGDADEAEFIAASVKNGQAALYKIEGSASGWIVLRGESLAKKNELVVVALTGKNAQAIGRALEVKAKELEYTSIRFHTNKDIMYHIAKKLGYVEQERVYGRFIQ